MDFLEPQPSVEKLASPFSLEAFIADQSLIEDPLMSVLDEEAITSFGFVYGKVIRATVG